MNADRDKSKIARLKEEHKVTWRSFWCGTRGLKGPIAKNWNITFLPTAYVIDHQGVIRHKNLTGKALDKAVDSLLAEMEQPNVARF